MMGYFFSFSLLQGRREREEGVEEENFPIQTSGIGTTITIIAANIQLHVGDLAI